MNVVIINKSDFTGGAAVVSFRLMNALRELGINADMLVVDKVTDSTNVYVAATGMRARRPFLAERLKIFLANGLDRSNLFKVDTASDGLPLNRHPLVRKADVICLNWVNQGMLSLKGLLGILRLGKPLVWTMHDMWNFTGICHHAGNCRRWHTNCGLCPFLGSGAKPDDISFSVWNNKHTVYSEAARLARNSATRLHFVAVSNWLADMARKSPLLADAPLSVIHNAFPIPLSRPERTNSDRPFSIVMGAARLDDPVKGLPILVEATRVLRENYPEIADNVQLITFGNVRDPRALDGIKISHRHLGLINGEDNIRNVYLKADAVVSTSLYETLPGTLVEGLVYGCIPVAFGRGGQADIVDHLSTGYIAEWDDDLHAAARNIANGIVWAFRNNTSAIRDKMFRAARDRFDAPVIAGQYISLFKSLIV